MCASTDALLSFRVIIISEVVAHDKSPCNQNNKCSSKLGRSEPCVSQLSINSIKKVLLVYLMIPHSYSHSHWNKQTDKATNAYTPAKSIIATSIIYISPLIFHHTRLKQKHPGFETKCWVKYQLYQPTADSATPGWKKNTIGWKTSFSHHWPNLELYQPTKVSSTPGCKNNHHNLETRFQPPLADMCVFLQPTADSATRLETQAARARARSHAPRAACNAL